MKSKKAIHIHFKSIDSLRNELLDLPKKRTAYVQPKDVRFFDSINSFRNFMTMQKVELLVLIANSQPKSVYELSKMVGRALGPVQNDCQSLAGTGFIDLQKQKSGRGSLKPKLTFNYDHIIVHVGEHPYSLRFEAA